MGKLNERGMSIDWAKTGIGAWALPYIREFSDGYWHAEMTESRAVLMEDSGDYSHFVKRGLAIGIAIGCGWLVRDPAVRYSQYGWIKITPLGRSALGSTEAGDGE